ncbi:MAG: hypothetical protein M3R67_06880 [Acidobacteriota bacterium]|nr:hypothetical protein [Acidobacteriota bacterium]
MEKQPLKFRIALVVFESAKSQLFKDRSVIFLFERLGDHGFWIHCIAGTSLMVENCGIEFLLGGEMPEDHSLRNARRLGNFFGGGTAKTPLRKKTNRHPKDLEPPVFRGHSRSAGHFGLSRKYGFSDYYFFTQKWVVPTG